MANRNLKQCQDMNQWLALTEHSLFDNNALLQVSDFMPIFDVADDSNFKKSIDSAISSTNSDDNIFVLPHEISDIPDCSVELLNICLSQKNDYIYFCEYRLRALQHYWISYAKNAVITKNNYTKNKTSKKLRKLSQHEENCALFSTKLGLLLVLPLLQSQSKTDTSICISTSNILLNTLHEIQPLGLYDEPLETINGLENLLCDWIDKLSSDTSLQRTKEIETVASSLVALVCARGHTGIIINCIHHIQRLKHVDFLPVADMMHRLSTVKLGQEIFSHISDENHILTWCFNGNSSTDNDEKQIRDKDEESFVSSICCDGQFLFCTNDMLRGLLKIGTGFSGTLRGHLYSQCYGFGSGRVAFCQSLLIFRPLWFDQQTDVFIILDPCTLKVLSRIKSIHTHDLPKQILTIGLTSDGVFVYHVWCKNSLEKGAKYINVYMDKHKVQNETEIIYIRRTLLNKSDAGPKNDVKTDKGLQTQSTVQNSSPFIGPTFDNSSKRDDAPTSTGVQLKTLARSAMYCDGVVLVIISQINIVPVGFVPRTVFGGCSTSSVKANLCFDVSNGQYLCQYDLEEAPSSHAANLLDLGACYDVINNVIWVSCNNWIDQYHNPGNLSTHTTNLKLLIPYTSMDLRNNSRYISIEAIADCLIEHVARTSVYHLTGNSFSDINVCVDLFSRSSIFLSHLCDILDYSIYCCKWNMVISCLLLLQFIFKINDIQAHFLQDTEIIKLRSLIFKLVETYNLKEASQELVNKISDEACVVLCEGFTVFYSTNESRLECIKWLMYQHESIGLQKVKEKLFMKFANSLKELMDFTEDTKYLKLNEELLKLVFNQCLADSIELLHFYNHTNTADLHKLTSSIPILSPYLQYISCLQTVLLRTNILTDSHDEDLPVNFNNDKYLVQSFTENVLTSSYEVFENILNICFFAHNQPLNDIDKHQELETVVKSTLPGQLLPLLLTSFIDDDFLTLPLADYLLTYIAKLISMACQVGLYLKSSAKVNVDASAVDSSEDLPDNPKTLVRYGLMTFSEEKLLITIGQILGMVLRANLPLSVDFHRVFWKNLLSIPIDEDADLKDVDFQTYNFIKNIEMIESEDEFENISHLLCSGFAYSMLDGNCTELIEDGHNVPVTWNKRHEYIKAIKSLRKRELSNIHRMNYIKLGLNCLVPLELFSLFTPADLEMCFCGSTYIDLNLLKLHTIYQVGLSENDAHIQYLWKTLECLSQQDLVRFVKFACNQDRLPSSCPCKRNTLDKIHVPPYPMKIAPPDSSIGNADSRLIRAETCIFMIKLPQYSCQEVMSQKIMNAISYRQDPLIG